MYRSNILSGKKMGYFKLKATFDIFFLKKPSAGKSVYE